VVDHFLRGLRLIKKKKNVSIGLPKKLADNPKDNAQVSTLNPNPQILNPQP
jgi:hypothetical protein